MTHSFFHATTGLDCKLRGPGPPSAGLRPRFQVRHDGVQTLPTSTRYISVDPRNYSNPSTALDIRYVDKGTCSRRPYGRTSLADCFGRSHHWISHQRIQILSPPEPLPGSVMDLSFLELVELSGRDVWAQLPPLGTGLREERSGCLTSALRAVLTTLVCRQNCAGCSQHPHHL